MRMSVVAANDEKIGRPFVRLEDARLFRFIRQKDEVFPFEFNLTIASCVKLQLTAVRIWLLIGHKWTLG